MRKEIIKLPNGGIIIFKKNKKIHQTIVNFGFKIRQIEKKNYGVAHFLEHMLFKGTKTKSLQQFQDTKSEICPTLNAYTSLSTINVVFKRTNKMIDKAISLASEIVLEPAIRNEDIEKEKSVILKELKLSTDKSETQVAIANRETMAKEPSFLAYSQIKVLGDEKIISAMTRKKLLDFKEKIFLKNNFVCSVTSSLSKRKIKKLICENLYNKLPFTNEALPEQICIANKESNLRVLSHERENKFSYMLTFTIDKKYEETRNDWNHSFASNILRRHIIRELRENGLIYTSSISISKMKEQLFLAIRVETTKDDFDKTLKIVINNIKDLRENFAPQEEIDYVKANFIYAEDEVEPRTYTSRNEGQLMAFLELGQYYKSLSRRQVLNKINACTQESIRNCFKEMFSANKIYMTILGKDLNKKDFPTLTQLKNKLK